LKAKLEHLGNLNCLTSVDKVRLSEEKTPDAGNGVNKSTILCGEILEEAKSR
jgi:hypothetical protein